MAKRRGTALTPAQIELLASELRGKSAAQPKPAPQLCPHARLIPGLDAEFCCDCRRWLVPW